MKYVVAILIAAVVIGGCLSLGVYMLLGKSAGLFFAKVIAGPVGLLGAGFGFVIYDALWPKKKS